MKKAIIFSIYFLFNQLLAFSQSNLPNKDSVEYQSIKGATDTNFVNKLLSEGGRLPEFQGGQAQLMNYLSQNIHYPQKAIENNIQGRVLVKFVVCTDGSLCNEEIVKSVDPSIDAEVIRVVKAMPKWKPGTKDGKAVKVYYTLPVTFNLGEKKNK